MHDSRRVLVLPVAGAFLVIAAMATVTRIDPDLWGHVRYGLDMLETWTLPETDPYSFTQDRPWVNHEWLSELQMGAAWAAGGTAGLALLKAALVVAAFVMVWSALGRTALGVRLVVLAIIVFGTARMVQTLRPQLWTLVCLLILMRVIVRGGVRRWWLPALFAVWANAHGGWIVGLGVLGAWAAADVWTEPKGARQWAGLVTACVLATLLTPYGLGLWEFMLGTVRMTRAIGEWQPLWTVPVLVWIPWLAVIVSSLWAVRSSSENRWHIVAVALMLGYASVRVERLLPLFVVSAAVVLGPWLRSRWPAPTSPAIAPSRHEPAVAVAIFLAAVSVSGWVAQSSLRCIPVRGGWVPDPVAASALASAVDGRIVTFFDWGQFTLWHWGPGLKVSMDGRRETVYSDRRLAEHDAIVRGEPLGLDTLGAWRPEYVWLPATSEGTRRWLDGNGYRIPVQTDVSFVAVRDDLPPLGAVDSRTVGASRCFPD